jgi:hypothetical protein
MNPLTPHCGSMMQGSGQDVKLCAPLAQLKEEHVSLTEKMKQFHTKT